MNIKIILTFLVVMAGCSASEEPSALMDFSTSTDDMVEIPPTMTPLEAPPELSLTQEGLSRKLIKNGSLEFETGDLQKTMSSIQRAAQSAGGYLSNEHSTTLHNQIWNTITVRVPSSEFDHFIKAVSRGVEKFDKREIESQDVTEEFVDLQARIKAKKKLEQRFHEILKTANTVKDILEVEAEAGKIREEIERAEGRLKFLKNQTAMSTIKIDFYKTTEAVALAENTFISSIKNGLANGVRIIEAVVIGLANIWPLLVLGLGGWFLYRHNARKVKTQE
ncbi:MAG: DUF4349 domain-containing protein [Roseivirga sp.]|nr:DUF4349 domain-containing protein [Roseivirga sp.]